MQQYQENQQSIENSRIGYNHSNSSHFNEMIRHLMLFGMSFNDSFCYQISSNLEGMPDNDFGTPFNVKSNTL